MEDHQTCHKKLYDHYISCNWTYFNKFYIYFDYDIQHITRLVWLISRRQFQKNHKRWFENVLYDINVLKVRGNSPKINPKNVKMVIGCNDHTGTA